MKYFSPYTPLLFLAAFAIIGAACLGLELDNVVRTILSLLF